VARLALEIVRGPRPAPRRTGIDATLVTRRREAEVNEIEKLVADASAEADRIRAAARVEAASVAREAAERAALDGERRWAEAALELAALRHTALDRLERECAMVAVGVARQVVGLAFDADPTLVAALVERACAGLRREAALTLRVGRSHVERIPELRAQLSGFRAVVVELDADLAPTDCIAECGGVRVDARLDVQLEILERRLLGEPTREVTT